MDLLALGLRGAPQRVDARPFARERGALRIVLVVGVRICAIAQEGVLVVSEGGKTTFHLQTHRVQARSGVIGHDPKSVRPPADAERRLTRMSDFNERIIAEFRANGGHVETAGFGDRLIILHSIGAKSGAKRESPLMGLPTEDGWLIAASKGGAPEEPAWAHNLRAHPGVEVETGEGRFTATAEELPRAERDAAWQRFVAASPGFADYERRTTRLIAVFHLKRS